MSGARSRGLVRLVSLVAAVMMAAACDDAQNADKAVPFTRDSLDGHQFSLPRDGDGKVVALHFWTGRSPGGASQLSGLESLWDANRERGLLLLAVDVGQDRAAVAALVAGRRFSYPVVLDPGETLARAYGVTTLPVTVLIDREGLVRARIGIDVPPAVLGAAIRTLTK